VHARIIYASRMRLAAALIVLIVPLATARADEAAIVRGGPKADAAKKDATASIAAASRDLLPCWRRGTSPVEIAITTDAGGAVTSSAARTDGPVAQCVAGILAVSTLRGGAWSGVVRVGPGGGGGGGDAPGGGDDVNAALAAHSGELKQCQKADARAAGVVQIDLRVHADGTITDVAVATALSPALDACLVKALAKLKLDGYRGKEVRYRLGLQYAGGDDGGGGAPRASSNAATPTKRGPLDVDQMMPVIEASRAGIDRCGQHVKKGGKLMIRFTIRKDGTVKNLAVTASIGDPKVEQCVLDRFAPLKFPTASDETQVQFPLVYDAP